MTFTALTQGSFASYLTSSDSDTALRVEVTEGDHRMISFYKCSIDDLTAKCGTIIGTAGYDFETIRDAESLILDEVDAIIYTEIVVTVVGLFAGAAVGKMLNGSLPGRQDSLGNAIIIIGGAAIGGAVFYTVTNIIEYLIPGNDFDNAKAAKKIRSLRNGELNRVIEMDGLNMDNFIDSLQKVLIEVN